MRYVIGQRVVLARPNVNRGNYGIDAGEFGKVWTVCAVDIDYRRYDIGKTVNDRRYTVYEDMLDSADGYQYAIWFDNFKINAWLPIEEATSDLGKTLRNMITKHIGEEWKCDLLTVDKRSTPNNIYALSTTNGVAVHIHCMNVTPVAP